MERKPRSATTKSAEMPIDTMEALQVGLKIVPDHTLKERLGVGEFGEVWKASGPGGSNKALKIIPLEGSKGLQEYYGIRRVREVRNVYLAAVSDIWFLDEQGRSLDNEAMDMMEAEIKGGQMNLGKTLDLNAVFPKTLVVSMELCDKTLGELLKEKIASGEQGIPVEELLRYMENAAIGIDYLNEPRHPPLFMEQGISVQRQEGDKVSLIHGDVKPDNIMLFGNSVKVCDFSLAKALGGKEQLRKSLTKPAGTVVYMAPESWRGKTTTKSDQYSLAITYCELRTGSWPYTEKAKSSFFEMQEAKEHESLDLSGLSEGEQTIIRRATSRDPEQRYDSCVEMVKALRLAITGTETDYSDRVSKSEKKSSMLIPLLLLALLVFAAYWWFPRPRHEYTLTELEQAKELPKAFVLAKMKTKNLEKVVDILRSKTSVQDGLSNQAIAEIDDELDNFMQFLNPDKKESESEEWQKFAEEKPALMRDLFQGSIDREIELLREAIDQCNPTEDSELLSVLQRESFPKSNGRVELFQRIIGGAKKELAAIRLSEIRIEARGSSRDAALLVEKLNKIKVDNLTSNKDKAYWYALISVLNSLPENQVGSRDDIEQLLEARCKAKKLFPDLSDPWEMIELDNWWKRIKGEIDLELILEWLNLPPDQQPSCISEIVEDPETYLDQAKKYRSKLVPDNLKKARECLQIAEKHESLTEELRERLRDELSILQIVDPHASVDKRSRILLEDSPEWDRWLRICDQLLKDYGSENSGLPECVKSFLKLLRNEALYMTGEKTDDFQKIEKYCRSVDDMFEPYAYYVRAITLMDEETEQAARHIRDRYQVSTTSGKVLQVWFRRREAVKVLMKTVEERGPPTDEDLLNHAYFDDEDRREQDENDLRLARSIAETDPNLPKETEVKLLAYLVLAMGLEPEVLTQEASKLNASAVKLLAEDGQHLREFGIEDCVKYVRGKTIRAIATSDEAKLRALSEALMGFTSQQLESAAVSSARRLKSELLKEALKISDRTWTRERDDTLNEAIGTIYRAAGFVYRNETIQEDLRIDGVEPAAEIHRFFQRSNSIMKNTESLLAEALALASRNQKPEAWPFKLKSLSEEIIEYARQEEKDYERAWGHKLKGYALVEQSRRSELSLEYRLSCLRNSIIEYDLAIKFLSQADFSVRNDRALAECYTDRSTARVEFVFFDQTRKEEKLSQLEEAMKDAKLALKIPNRKNKEYAWIAWGNALEDVAYYVKTEPSEFEQSLVCFQEADEKFSQARKLASLAFDDHALIRAELQIMRCQVRWSEKLRKLGSDPNQQTLKQLKKSVARGSGIKQPAIDTDVLLKSDYAQLRFWLSKAYEALHNHSLSYECAVDAMEIEKMLPRGDRWIDYQYHVCLLVLSSPESEITKPPAMELLDEILSNARRMPGAVASSSVADAAVLKLKLAKKEHKAAELERLLSLFTAESKKPSDYDFYEARLRLAFFLENDYSGELESGIKYLESLAIRLEKLNNNMELVQYQSLENLILQEKAKLLVSLGGTARNKNENHLAYRYYKRSADCYQQIINNLDEQEERKGLVKDIPTVGSNIKWKKLSQPTAVKDHLTRTYDIRLNLFETLSFAALSAWDSGQIDDDIPKELANTAIDLHKGLRFDLIEFVSQSQKIKWSENLELRKALESKAAK